MQHALELFTVTDYKDLIRNVKRHFEEECNKWHAEVNNVNVYFNPESSSGCIVYNLGMGYVIAEQLRELHYSIGMEDIVIGFTYN
jgi:hypothetical protein